MIKRKGTKRPRFAKSQASPGYYHLIGNLEEALEESGYRQSGNRGLEFGQWLLQLEDGQASGTLVETSGN